MLYFIKTDTVWDDGGSAIKKKNKFIIIFAFALVFCAGFLFYNNAFSMQEDVELAETIRQNVITRNMIDFDVMITDFEWDEMVVFGKYSNPIEFFRMTGITPKKLDTPIRFSETISLIVFVNNKKIVAFVNYPINKGDFRSIGLFQRESSKFNVESGHAGVNDWYDLTHRNYEPPIPIILVEAIAEALDSRRYAFFEGESFSSAYKVLWQDEYRTRVTVYLIATHGWYSRETALKPISGCGIVFGILSATLEDGVYIVDNYSEYDLKQLLDSEDEIFPVRLVEEVQANADTYLAALKEAERKNVVEHFGFAENSEVHVVNDIEMKLFSDKKVYKTTEKIHIWATLEYVGENDAIKIWSGLPHMGFSITDGKDFNTDFFIFDILRETVLKKGEVSIYRYEKSGSWNSEFWESPYQERDLYLPAGEYTVSVVGAFSSVEPNGEPSGLLCELQIKVEK